MVATLVVILIVATFLAGCLAVYEDINQQCEKALLDDLWDDLPELAEGDDLARSA